MRIDAIIVRDHRETYVATIDDEIVKGKEEKKGKNHRSMVIFSVAVRRHLPPQSHKSNCGSTPYGQFR